MNINVYLPDDLGKRAKDAGLPLSRLLRNAVTDELEMRKIRLGWAGLGRSRMAGHSVIRARQSEFD